ncbi:MAG TPA: hypothetical protein VJB82_00915 [Candidatus Peribacterales bacterium]|nr:hypothetical protein [Candidatus Peribacterales bacterium]
MSNCDQHECEPKSSVTARIGEFLVKYKYAIAATGVLGMSAISGLMNADHGWNEVQHAAVNQMIHSGISAASLIKIHEVLARKVRTLTQECIPIVVPAVLTTSVCYLIHKLGIPYLREPSSEPALSTLPTAVVIAIIMPIYHIAHRSRSMSEKMRTLFKQ